MARSKAAFSPARPDNKWEPLYKDDKAPTWTDTSPTYSACSASSRRAPGEFRYNPPNVGELGSWRASGKPGSRGMRFR